MKVTLLEVYSDHAEYINKDVMGEYGMVAQFGESFWAKLISASKKRTVNIPVFALSYFASLLKKNGHEVEYRYNNLPKDADLVIIPSSIVDYKYELEVAEKLRKETKAKVGFFGPFATFAPDLYLKSADFVIVGEPESAIAKIKDGQIPSGIVKTEPLKDLDILPFPDWSIFPIANYSYKPNLRKSPFVTVLSSRGCVYNCLYCPYKAYYGTLRMRDAKKVVEELKYLKNKFKVASVQFRDPIFTANRQRTIAIAQGIIDNDLGIEWGCETHVNCLDEELIDILYKAGMRSVNLGIESADANLLKANSRISASKQKEISIIEYCHKKGINVAAFYILGMPNDTRETVLNTIAYAKSLNTLVAQFFVFTPFPGTPYYQSLKDKIFESDWEKFNSFTPVFKHDNMSSREISELKENAFVSYYFRSAYLLKYWRKIFF